MWNLAPLCLMWLLWREKSSPTFENEELLEVNLKLSFLDYVVDGQLSWVSYMTEALLQRC